MSLWVGTIIHWQRKMLGNKTKNLAVLEKIGLNVPPFFGIGNKEVGELFDKNGVINDEKVKGLAAKVVGDLKVERYAVRSSGLMEDADGSSYAGQFRTELDQPAEALDQAIALVLNHAYKFLKGDVSQFSILVQEYIEPDYAGVIFSRNPIGGRGMVLEYFGGAGDVVVSGKVTPVQEEFYWKQSVDLPQFQELIEAAKKIEKEFGAPQDIEWCMRGGELFLLQARPITTLTRDQYEGYLYLDEHLPAGDFFYEQTEISEIAQQPCRITFDLLKEIYKKGGPADLVYQKYGIDYVETDFLQAWGNELYVDREKEIKSLLPAYSYLGREFQLHLAGFSGIWRTLKNMWRIARISLLGYSDLKLRLMEALNRKVEGDFGTRLESFFKDYQLIFEINLLAAKALKRLDQALLKEEVANALVIQATFDDDYEGIINFDSRGLKGNTLDIADEGEFIYSLDTPKMDIEVERWYKGLSDLKRRLYLPICVEAQRYNKLREFGRWLTVKNVSGLREALPKKKNVYFAQLDEVLKGRVDEVACAKRAAENHSFDRFNFPARIYSEPINTKDELLGVSGGQAHGRVATVDDLKKGDILYTKILSPELTQYFDKVSGIISEKGGMLSHLAIMARENKIPVVVGFDIERSTVVIGDMVKIDGGLGTVKEI